MFFMQVERTFTLRKINVLYASIKNIYFKENKCSLYMSEVHVLWTLSKHINREDLQLSSSVPI